ncbi:MAG TPA: hypothetical protein VMM93_09475 [Vicinamibacterales bacterium]|nr:hypothetical protein [Vicinamibacterales bacterium]
MVTRGRTEDGQLQRFTVTRSDRGWEVCERHDERVVRTSHYDDWHRVERAVQVFELGVRRAD